MPAGTTSSPRRRSAPRWRWPRWPTSSGLTVVLIGTPAEEAGGGKALMLEAGAFDDIAATVMLHPGPLDIAAARSLALSEVDGPLPRPGIARRRRAVSRRQRRRRGHRRPGGDRPAAPAAGARARWCTASSPTAARPPTSFPARAELRYTMRAHRLGVAARAGRPDGRLLRGRRGGHRLRARRSPRRHPPTPSWRPTAWLADDVPRRDGAARAARPVPEDLEAALPLGSTDMGNVTQVMPGIHPIVGIDAGGASVHQPAFAAAAVGPSADTAVVEGAIMLARTVVALAETRRPSGTGCCELQAEAGVMSLSDARRRLAGRALRRSGRVAPAHPPPPRTGPPGVRDHAVRRRRSWPMRASTPRCCPAERG